MEKWFYKEEYRAASPRNFVTPAHPPTLLYHGRLDLLVETDQSRNYHQTLREHGVESRFMQRHLFGHLATFQFDRPTRRAALRHFENFMGGSD